jgi:CBS domain-containing protein
MRCPFCRAENLEGVEVCEACGQDLTAQTRSAEDSLARTLLGHLRDVPVNVPLLLPPTASVADAVAMMRERRHGSVQIVTGGQLVGIFTESDLLRRVDPKADLSKLILAEVMTRDPQRYQPDMTVAAALHGMAQREHRHLPLFDERGELQGFLSVRGLLRHIQARVGL